jgi:hypothetical protein
MYVYVTHFIVIKVMGNMEMLYEHQSWFLNECDICSDRPSVEYRLLFMYNCSKDFNIRKAFNL